MALAVRVVSIAIVVVWVAALIRIDHRAMKGRAQGKAVALAFIALGIAGLFASLLIPD